MNELELKAYPFCGSERSRSNLYCWEYNSDNCGHYVYCESCGAQGPVVESGENRWDEAREAWNRRTNGYR